MRSRSTSDKFFHIAALVGVTLGSITSTMSGDNLLPSWIVFILLGVTSILGVYTYSGEFWEEENSSFVPISLTYWTALLILFIGYVVPTFNKPKEVTQTYKMNNAIIKYTPDKNFSITNFGKESISIETLQSGNTEEVKVIEPSKTNSFSIKYRRDAVKIYNLKGTPLGYQKLKN